MTTPSHPVLQDRGEAAKALLGEPGIVLNAREALALAVLSGDIPTPNKRTAEAVMRALQGEDI